MTPRKPKQFIKPTAEALQQSESMVGDVVSFYWSSVRKALSDLKSPSLTVTNLGTFKVRYNQIERLEKKYQHYLDNLVPEKMSFNKHTLQNVSIEKINNLKRIREMMQEEHQRKLEVRKKRTEYVTNKGLEEQGKDPRRD